MAFASMNRVVSSWTSSVLLMSLVLLSGLFACQQPPPTESNKEPVVDNRIVDASEPTPEPEPIVEKDEPIADTTDARSPEPDPPEVIEKQAILKPETIVPVKKSVSEWKLPASLTKVTSVSINLQTDLSLLLGTSSGLYQVKSDKITRIADKKIVGIVDWMKDINVVATAKTVYRFEDELQSTQLADSLEDSPILALAARQADSFWLGTQASLWLLEKDTLKQFVDFAGAKSLQSQQGKDAVYGLDHKGQPFALQNRGKDQWSLVFFNKEKSDLVQVLPANADHTHFWGLDKDGHLWLRKQDKDQAAWWPYRVKPDKDDKPTLQWTKLLLDPKTGQVWAWDGKKSLSRLSENTISELEVPEKLKTLLWVHTTTDGALWMSDGTILVRLGDAGPVISYKGQIEPFLKKYCTKCHTSSGVGRRFLLDTYTNAKTHSSKVLYQVQKGLMPPGNPLGKAETELLQKWIAGGSQP